MTCHLCGVLQFPLPPITGAIYSLLLIAGLILSTTLWRRAPRSREIPTLVYLGALLGAVAGAKLGYLLCEAPFIPHDENFWMNLFVGRTILGGLFGGYLGVEWAKRLVNFSRPTGDTFAVALPFGIAVGRIGCMIHGCCPGRVCRPAWYAVTGMDGMPRLPVATVEMLFQLSAWLVLWHISRTERLRGQLFHLYLMAYGLFRFTMETYRETPRFQFGLSTYQVLAAALFLFAGGMFWKRFRQVELPQSIAESTVNRRTTRQ